MGDVMIPDELIVVSQSLLLTMAPWLLLLIPLYFVVRGAVRSGVRQALKDGPYKKDSPKDPEDTGERP